LTRAAAYVTSVHSQRPGGARLTTVSFMAYFRFVRPPADKPVEAWPSRGLN